MLHRESIEAWLEGLQESIRLMERYCDHKRDVEDWHGVMDAAADLRELLITQRTLRLVLMEEEAVTNAKV